MAIPEFSIYIHVYFFNNATSSIINGIKLFKILKSKSFKCNLYKYREIPITLRIKTKH